MNNLESCFDSILVIDDNEAIHTDFAKIFADIGGDNELDKLAAEMFGEDLNVSSESKTDYQLEFASQGEQGLQILKAAWQENRKFGMAFVDMRMPPGWDGVETIEQLWKVDPDLQVVICTAYSDRSWDEIFQRIGGTDKLLILKKPFDTIEVVQLATSLCEKRRLLEASRSREENLQGVVRVQETELIEAHKDAEVLIDSMSSILISLDENGFVSRWNPVATDVFGFSSEDAIKMDFRKLPIQWNDYSKLEQAFSGCDQLSKTQLELQFKDASGTTRTLDTTICPILYDQTKRARLFLATDITRQKALQMQLDQALRLESVGQLAAGVAHEINTPMQYIGDNIHFVAESIRKLDSLLEMMPCMVDEETSDEQIAYYRKELSQSFKPSKVKSSLRQIPEALQDSIEGVTSVSNIVAAMKAFSHPGNEEKSKVCMNQILNSTITVAKNEWKYVADIETNFDEHLASIEGLASELNQAFLNIIVNASHAIGDRVDAEEIARGKILITTQNSGDDVIVTIEDNGGGIPMHVRDKIFDPFFTTKDVGKGTGQGLSIAHTVVSQKHGGDLSFSVKEGVGTTFSIKIPQESVPEVKTERELAGAEG